jgi:hypothetical protein
MDSGVGFHCFDIETMDGCILSTLPRTEIHIHGPKYRWLSSLSYTAKILKITGELLKNVKTKSL